MIFYVCERERVRIVDKLKGCGELKNINVFGWDKIRVLKIVYMYFIGEAFLIRLNASHSLKHQHGIDGKTWTYG